jgi:3-oxoacyl-[acyl-carrier protein] reductase
MDLDLRDAAVLVGGSSRGIGYGIASALLEEGARVALTGRDENALDTAAQRLRADHGEDRVAAHPGDLHDPAHCAAVVAAVAERWDGLDGVVANVGSGTATPGWRVEAQEWDAVFDANLWTSVRLATAALEPMAAAGAGSLVFVGSIVGVETVSAPLSYSAAKAALMSYVKGLAHEVGSAGVRVNAVIPGNVLFPGGSWDRRVSRDPDRWERYLEAEVPLRRFGTPSDIADPVAFLLSTRASFVTGACLVADGGQTRSMTW